MDVLLPVFAIAFFSIIAWLIRRNIVAARREQFIRNYDFPDSISIAVSKTYPHLTEREVKQVVKGLREYFMIVSLAPKKMIAMPSQAIDVAWHQFILFTREYQRFCATALGRFLHHTPAEAMKTPVAAQESIKRTWRIACHREGIKPHSPNKLPFVFAIDARLKIKDGFHYELNCMKQRSSKSGGSETGTGGGSYCGSHIGCSSGCAGSAGDGGCAGDSGGGGCGGD